MTYLFPVLALYTIALFILLISGQYFLVMLAAVAGFFLLAGIHYVLWGWKWSRPALARQPHPGRSTRPDQTHPRQRP
jgi:hypothetical protein